MTATPPPAPEPLDWITIRDLRVSCIVGVFTEERTEPQALSVDLRLGLRTREAARLGRISQTVDYEAVAGQVRFLLTVCRFRLIETAAETVAAYLLAPPALGERRAQLQRVGVEIHKPGALAPATARLSIERDAGSSAVTVEQTKFGTVDVLFETAEWGLYRLNVAPGSAIPMHVHQVMREHELVLSGGLVARGRTLYPGTAFHWPRGAAHEYRNPTTQHQTILCVDSPPFLPDDEIEVDGEAADVPPEHLWTPRGADGWSLGPEPAPAPTTGSRR